MSKTQPRNEHSTDKDSALTDIAIGLGGSAALGLMGLVVAPILGVPAAPSVAVGALAGLLAAYFAKKLDTKKQLSKETD